MQSKNDENNYYVAWPSRPPRKDRGEMRWKDQVRITNKKVKSIIEQDLISSVKNKIEIGREGSLMTDIAVDVSEGLLESPLTVTDVKVKDITGGGDLIATAQVDLNYAFRIFDIKVLRRKGEIFLEFPVYVSNKGKKFDQMKIFSRQLRQDIKRAIVKQMPADKQLKKIGFEISKFEPFWKESTMKYFCAVTINGALEVECKIMQSKGSKPFVSWPSSKEGDDYVDKVIPCNQKVKEAIEAVLLKRYSREKKK
jgi:DNA-binding cell septation regulator SpoVG